MYNKLKQHTSQIVEEKTEKVKTKTLTNLSGAQLANKHT
jgi:hypothetical protein